LKITISLGQMDVHIGEPERNIECVREWIVEAARRGSDLVVFPELWDTGYALERAGELASPLGEGRFAEIAGLAKEHGLYVTGSLMEDREGAACNCMAMFSPQGETLGAYRKLHLFRLMDEEKYLTEGDEPLALDLPWGRTGLAICYDLRFPELFRRYALEGAKLALLPSEWPHPRLAHWRTLLRARAIENQMFVVACNRVGVSKDTHFFGHSTIVDPWGETVVEGGESEMLLTAEIDLALVDEVRQRIPIFEDRRPEVY
jgi:predicted amidohydrolase